MRTALMLVSGTALLVVLIAWTTQGQTERGGKPVIEIIKTMGPVELPKVSWSARPLEDAAGGVRQMAPSSHYIRAFGSPAQNSRTPGSPGGGAWHVRWEAQLPSLASAVLVAGDRVVAQRSNGWTLLDRNGHQIAEGISGGAAITLDPSSGAFFALGMGNAFQTLALDRGDLRFKFPLGYNEFFVWPILHRSGTRLIAAAVELPMIGPKPQPPTKSLFHITEVASPLKLSPYKILLSISANQDLVFKEPNMIPVASRDILWAAMPGLLIRTSPAENIDGAWSGSFKPIAASADEAGWLHLVVETGPEGHRVHELWIVTTEGRRTVRGSVPPAYASSTVPPVIGYDHRVYLRNTRSVAAFSPEGKLIWETSLAGEIAGTSVTPDGRIVAAAGTAIWVLDTNGKSTQLASLSVLPITAPVVTAEGEILVGTGAGVVCLVSR